LQRGEGPKPEKKNVPGGGALAILRYRSPKKKGGGGRTLIRPERPGGRKSKSCRRGQDFDSDEILQLGRKKRKKNRQLLRDYLDRERKKGGVEDLRKVVTKVFEVANEDEILKGKGGVMFAVFSIGIERHRGVADSTRVVGAGRQKKGGVPGSGRDDPGRKRRRGEEKLQRSQPTEVPFVS